MMPALPPELWLLVFQWCPGIDERRKLALALGWSPSTFIKRLKRDRDLDEELRKLPSRRTELPSRSQISVTGHISLPMPRLAGDCIVIRNTRGNMEVRQNIYQELYFDEKTRQWTRYSDGGTWIRRFTQVNQTPQQLRESLTVYRSI